MKEKDKNLSQKSIDYWVEISRYDLKVAKSLFSNKHYLYAGFMCHQSIEKLLKGYYAKIKNVVPPYTHSLAKLSMESNIADCLDMEQKDLLDELTPLNIEARYPAYKERISKLLPRNKTKELILKTEEFWLWLRKKI